MGNLLEPDPALLEEELILLRKVAIMGNLLEPDPALLEEELILLRKVAATLPDRVHCSTPMRWADRGLKRDSQVIRLEAIAIGGRRYTSRQALARFFSRLSGASPATPGSPLRPHERMIRKAEQADAIFGR